MADVGLIVALAKAVGGGGGGGGGTTDYSDLDNKPRINNVTLSGNKSASDLGLQAPITGSTGDVGKYVKTKTVSGGVVTEYELEAPLDVQINGTSIVDDGVAEIPIASSNNLGLIKVESYGISLNSNNVIKTLLANDNLVKAGSNSYNPIVPNNQHRATFYGLAKAAGADEKDSTETFGTYTDAAKVAIQQMLGVYHAPFRLIYENTITEETGDITIASDIGNNPFSLSEILVLFDNVVATGSSSGGIAINNTSVGSNIPYLAISSLYNTTGQTRTAHIQIIGGRMFGETEATSMANAYTPVDLQNSKNASGWMECDPITRITILSLNGYKFTSGTIQIYGR